METSDTFLYFWKNKNLKKTFLLYSFIILTSCISVKNYNQHLEKPISAEKLHQDVDFAYQNLKKLHPELYWYISKEKLDYKFDSLKASITKPLNPSEFFQKIAPVVAEVRQGHLRMVSPAKKLTRKELKNLEQKKGLFSRYNFVVEKDRIYVKDNSERIKNMEVGTEILTINGEKVKTMLQRYKPYITSDGFNTTYHKYSIAKRWPAYFTIENGILDSVRLETNYHNKAKEFWLKREKITKHEKKTEKKEIKTKERQRKNDDYNAVTKSYNRALTFKTKDSSIAIMKVKTFSGIRSKKFYRTSFDLLKKAKTRFLILDMRDNLGGSLSEINNLYSYLGANQFPFIKDIEVNSRASLLEGDYFSEFPWFMKPVAFAVYPFYLVGSIFSVKKSKNKYFLRNNGIFSIKKPKKHSFTGKIYVLINGSSFSAASILPSKIKGDQRATIVGEETGGANDGTVAGRYSTKKLPHSKLKFPIGLMLIKPNIEFTNTMKGVIPDHQIVPNLTQILMKKDPAMDWIFRDIERLNSTVKTQK